MRSRMQLTGSARGLALRALVLRDPRIAQPSPTPVGDVVLACTATWKWPARQRRQRQQLTPCKPILIAATLWTVAVRRMPCLLVEQEGSIPTQQSRQLIAHQSVTTRQNALASCTHTQDTNATIERTRLVVCSNQKEMSVGQNRSCHCDCIWRPRAFTFFLL